MEQKSGQDAAENRLGRLRDEEEGRTGEEHPNENDDVHDSFYDSLCFLTQMKANDTVCWGLLAKQ